MKYFRIFLASVLLAATAGASFAQNPSTPTTAPAAVSSSLDISTVTVAVSGTTSILPFLSNLETEPAMVPQGAVIDLRVKVAPNEAVLVTAFDGGQLENGTCEQQFQADANGVVKFSYTLGTATGHYRLGIDYNGKRRFLKVWAGEPLPQRGSKTSTTNN